MPVEWYSDTVSPTFSESLKKNYLHLKIILHTHLKTFFGGHFNLIFFFLKIEINGVFHVQVLLKVFGLLKGKISFILKSLRVVDMNCFRVLKQSVYLCGGRSSEVVFREPWENQLCGPDARAGQFSAWVWSSSAT